MNLSLGVVDVILSILNALAKPLGALARERNRVVICCHDAVVRQADRVWLGIGCRQASLECYIVMSREYIDCLTNVRNDEMRESELSWMLWVD